MKKIRNENRGELYFVLYLFQFSLLKPITSSVKQYSTILLLGSTILLLLLTVVFGKISKRNLKRWFFIVSGVGCCILFDTIFRHNTMQGEIFYNYAIYAIIPLFLLTVVKNYTAVLKYYSIISIIVGVLFIVDPFIGYQWSGNYMQFGFGVMLPAFCGTVIEVFYFNNKKMYLAMLPFLLEMLICANKSSFATAVALLVVAYISFNYRKGIKWIRLISISLIMLVLYTFRLQIFDTFISIADRMGFYSYSLTTIRISLTGKSELIWGGRFSIWEGAFEIFAKAPIIGRGIGYMEGQLSSTGYSHNVELDILVSSGIMGITIYIIVLLKSIINFYRCHNYAKKIFMLILLVLWFIPMQFSLTLWKVTEFWVYWGVCFYYDSSKGGQIVENIGTDI